MDGATTPRLHKVVVDFAERDLAHRVAGVLQDLIEPAPDALTIFEQARQTGGSRPITPRRPISPSSTARVQDLLGVRVPALREIEVPDLDWVALSQAALPPVAAGRFTVYGSHDRGRVPRGPNAILIDAGEAFGTAHHATTFGCLAALDALTRRGRFVRVLDLGCGSGVLAIALACALPRAAILATDLDAPPSRWRGATCGATGWRGASRRLRPMVSTIRGCGAPGASISSSPTSSPTRSSNSRAGCRAASLPGARSCSRAC